MSTGEVLDRAFSLYRRHFRVLLLTGILTGALFYAFLMPGLPSGERVQPGLLVAWPALVGFTALVLSFPIGTVAISLLYYDQRVRKEAFDLQRMLRSLGQFSAERSITGASVG